MSQKSDQHCAVCEGANGALCTNYPTGGDRLGFECEACGQYEVSRSALITWFGSAVRLDARQRAALSHILSTTRQTDDVPVLTTYWLEKFAQDARLPNVALQAANLIRLIGDYQSTTGDGYFIDEVIAAPRVGSFNLRMFNQLRAELQAKALISRIGDDVTRPNPRAAGVLSAKCFGLTLDGWERYEAERTGKIAGRYGFLALKFDEPELEALVSSKIKPHIKETLGYDVVDMRNVARAGLIDNIMREQIRDAAFVLVDLTHDNSGAYWEAGYAEGLGKPVVYICEKSKFDTAKTHFDTNHCTTVTWSNDDPTQFMSELVATLRRSLNLF